MLDSTLLKIFEAEQQEHVARIRALLEPAGDAAPLSSPAQLEEALRRAHTLKGAARAVGLAPTELLAHGVETVFARIRDAALTADGGVLAVIRRALDAVEDVLAGVIEDRPEPDTTPLLGEIQRILRPRAGPPEPHPEPHPAQQPRNARESRVAPEPRTALAPQPAQPHQAATPESGADLVRVDTRTIDDLVRAASQLLASARSHGGATADVSRLSDRIVAAGRELARLRQRAAPGLRRAAADPRMAPLVECIEYIGREFDSLAREARTVRTKYRRSAWSLQQIAIEQHLRACRVRMTPAETVFGGFAKMVRDLARDYGRQVEFRAEGLQVLADRLVLQELKDPVMHLLRNAVAHGVEAPEERVAAGKTATGLVSLFLSARGDRLHLAVEDDGRGPDLPAIARAAVKRGLLAESAVASLSWPDALKLIFEPGLSTSSVLTTLAGRGMGMSIVREAVSRLQGDVRVERREPCGTVITISAPLSISTQQVLLAACGGHVFGIPGAAIERLRRVELGDIETLEGAEVIRADSGTVPLARLADLLGIESGNAVPDSNPGEPAPAVPVVVVHSGGQRVGLVVDRLVDRRDALVKDLGLDASSSGLATGGVFLEDGAVAVVLNPAALIDGFRRSGKTPGLKREAEAAPKAAPSILVVDDSMTTRSLEKSMLEAYGYRVRVAVDGVEALERIREQKPDLVISDVMMPRMDGLALLDRMKSDKETAEIPVILVTSLDKQEDQERGLSLGADAYIVKQKFNQRELLNTIRQII